MLGLSCTLYGTSSCQAYSTVLWPSRWWPSPSGYCRRCDCLRGWGPAACRGGWKPEGSPYRSKPGQSSQTASPHFPSPPPSLPSSPAAADDLVWWGSRSARCGYTLSLAGTVMSEEDRHKCYVTLAFSHFPLHTNFYLWPHDSKVLYWFFMWTFSVSLLKHTTDILHGDKALR